MSRRVAVLGLGARGTRWARACLDVGWEVAGFDPDDRAGRTLGGAGWRREGTISATVRRADWVICCLPERLELVQMVIQRVQAEAPRSAGVAVDIRGQDVEAVQGCALRPGQVVRVCERPDGGVALDVSSRNDEALRDEATGLLAELTAVLSLDPGAIPAETPRAGREA